MKTASIYQKSLRSPYSARVLKPGSNNAKLGFKITSPKWKGKRLYSLTLEERTTCPTSCHHWDDCYGNNMPFAHRFTTVGLEKVLQEEIDSLMLKHPQGIVIRLHVLGDFYDVGYVEFWEKMLLHHPELCLFGYTGREEDTDIGRAIWLVNNTFNERCVIRFSRSKEYRHGNRYAAEESFEGTHFVCPEQTGKLPSCAACGLCWSVPKTVKFLSH